MRESIREFVKICSETLPIVEPIYEFGSLQVLGQEGFADLRPFFPSNEYVGTDMQQGPGVDIVLDLHDIDLPDNSVGTALSMDTFEHVEYPRKAIEEIYRVVKPGGLFILSSHLKAGIHSYPNDYWRFTPDGFRSLLKPFHSSFASYAGDERCPPVVIGIGFKDCAPDLRKLEGAIKCWQLRWSSSKGRRPKESFIEKQQRKLKKSFSKRFNRIQIWHLK